MPHIVDIGTAHEARTTPGRAKLDQIGLRAVGRVKSPASQQLLALLSTAPDTAKKLALVRKGLEAYDEVDDAVNDEGANAMASGDDLAERAVQDAQ